MKEASVFVLVLSAFLMFMSGYILGLGKGLNNDKIEQIRQMVETKNEKVN